MYALNFNPLKAKMCQTKKTFSNFSQTKIIPVHFLKVRQIDIDNVNVAWFLSRMYTFLRDSSPQKFKFCH